MEDINNRGDIIPVNMLFGNQVWGIPPHYATDRDPVEVLRSIYMKIAVIHAQYWRDKYSTVFVLHQITPFRSLLQVKWLKGAKWYNGRGKTAWETGIARSKFAWEAVKQRVSSGQLPITLSPKLQKVIDKSFQNTTWEALQQHLHDPKVPFTLCHGDFHAANMMMVKSSGKVLMFDWSEVHQQ